jgi:hypothetical protein
MSSNVGVGPACEWASWHQKERAVGAGQRPIGDALGRLVRARQGLDSQHRARDTGVGRGGDNWGGNRGGTRERGRRLTHGPQGDAGPWASGLAGRVSWV